MTTYIALLRAVNVGGSGKLPMSDLKAMCAERGFSRIETYIASGNVVFDCRLAAARVQAQLEEKLAAYAGKEIRVFIRTASEMLSVLEANPFKRCESRHVYTFFLNEQPSIDFAEASRGRVDEEMGLGIREIYVYFPTGMGKSKLQIPAARVGTARNINTIAKLVEMSSGR